MKLWLIHLADIIDDTVFRHRFYWVCQKIGMSDWWGEDDCNCKYCVKWIEKHLLGVPK